jgi:hypothetical protein
VLLRSEPGLDVALASRSEASFRSLVAKRPELAAARFVRCDIDDDADLSAALQGVDLVVHTAGCVTWRCCRLLWDQPTLHGTAFELHSAGQWLQQMLCGKLARLGAGSGVLCARRNPAPACAQGGTSAAGLLQLYNSKAICACDAAWRTECYKKQPTYRGFLSARSARRRRGASRLRVCPMSVPCLAHHPRRPFQRKERCAVLEAALAARVAYMDVCDDADYSQRARGYHQQAVDAGVPAITTAGIYPGISNVRLVARPRHASKTSCGFSQGCRGLPLAVLG